MLSHIFISHTTSDDPFVTKLRQTLERHGRKSWVDSREMSGGDELDATVFQAIDDCSAVIVVISPDTPNSRWVKKEVEYALKQGKRVIPLLLAGSEPSSLWIWFGDNVPVAIVIDPAVGGLQTAEPQLLSALGIQLPEDHEPIADVVDRPLDELRLELWDVQMRLKDGARRPTAQARLYFDPADPTLKSSKSRTFEFVAPVGAIELEELRWYLESYPGYLSKIVIDQRARAVEAGLPAWGAALYEAAFDQDSRKTGQNAITTWRSRSEYDLLFSVEVAMPEIGAEAGEAATQLLTLPWELLHDGDSFLQTGKRAIRVRRFIPVTQVQERQPSTLPIRILLVSPRPELQADGTGRMGYIDHRASARPMVAAVEALGELAQLTLLHPPTFGALDAELRRANEAKTPYHVVHIDGHGVYDKKIGLGALCFESPQDSATVGKRRVEMIDADKLAGMLRGYGIPLVFLDACQTAQSDEHLDTSVAARLLQQGITSVVAMSHTVLVETAQRFVRPFYRALAEGKTVSAAMVDGQRALKSDSYRGKKLGGDLRLHDWFVPVLYQEELDPHLFTRVLPARVHQLEMMKQARALGNVPQEPEQTFVGRSRELLMIERLLTQPTAPNLSYIVIRGTGGAGKTTIAAECARWFVRSKRFERAAFVSLETHTHVDTILYQLGEQLLPQGENSTVTQQFLPIERALRDRGTVIVLDNVETILGMKPSPSPSQKEGDLEKIWALCLALLKADPRTRIIFTSRERLPAPFNHAARHVELGALSVRDAIDVVERVMNAEGWQPAAHDQGMVSSEVSALVNAVNRHARALVLLAREVARQGVNATTADLTAIMAQLDQKHPGDRENSLYASVELSLRRLADEQREKVAQLAVVHGGGHLFILRAVMGVDFDEAAQLAVALAKVGLATVKRYNYVRLDPALPAYWEQTLPTSALPPLRQRWADGMIQLTDFLYSQKSQDAELAAQLTLLELPNLVALLQQLKRERETGEREAARVADVAGSVEALVAPLGQPAVLALAVDVRETAANQIGAWSQTLFQNEDLKTDRYLQQGDLRSALQSAQNLLETAKNFGENAYMGADYDIAMAYFSLGRVLKNGGQAAHALPHLEEAQTRFEAVAASRQSESAERMTSGALTEQADCLMALGQLDAAASIYEQTIERAKKLEDNRQIATNTFQLGTVWMLQKRYADALTIYAEARERFEELGEPNSVAQSWHGIGNIHMKVNAYEQAEDAFQQALAIQIGLNNEKYQAVMLNQLGLVSKNMGRLEDAVVYYRKGVDIAVALGDLMNEGKWRNNIADTLVELGRYDEARQEITRAIECKKSYGHVAEPWKTWDILCDIEKATGNGAAADGAWSQARSAYFAYRRQGGYAQGTSGQLCDQLVADWDVGTQTIVSLQERDDLSARWQTFLTKLAQVVNGERNPALADDTALDYDDAAELLFLMERVGK